jgi:hypothetical protein
MWTNLINKYTNNVRLRYIRYCLKQPSMWKVTVRSKLHCLAEVPVTRARKCLILQAFNSGLKDATTADHTWIPNRPGRSLLNRDCLYWPLQTKPTDGLRNVETEYRQAGGTTLLGFDFRRRLDRPRGSPSFLYNGYRVFPGGKETGAWCWPPRFFYSAFGKSLCSYKRCWKGCPRASIQAWTRLIN